MSDLDLLLLEQERRRRAGLQASGAPQPAAPSAGITPPVPSAPEGSASAQKWGGGRSGAFVAGLGDAGIKAYLSLKQLAFGDLNDEEKNVLKMMDSDAQEDPGAWRGAGELAANVVTTAIPGGAVSKAAQATNLVRSAATGGRLARAAAASVPAATQMGGSAAQEFLLTPGEGEGRGIEDRLKNAGLAAATAGVLSAGGNVLKKSLTQPFRPSQEAKHLMEEGVVPKLQEGADSWVGRAVGRLTKGSIDPGGDRESEEAIKAIAKRMMPGVDIKNYNQDELISALQNHFTSGFQQNLGGKVYTLSPVKARSILSAGRQEVAGRTGVRQEYERAMANILPTNGNGQLINVNLRHGDDPTRGLSRYRRKFDDAIESLEKQGDVDSDAAAKAVRAAKDRFIETVRNSALSADELANVQNLEKNWATFKGMHKAMNSAKGQAEWDVGDLVNSYKGKFDVASGAYPNADLLAPANRQFTQGGEEGRRFMVGLNRALGIGKVAIGGGATLATASTPAAAILAPAYGASLIGQTRGGARYLFGDLDWQKKLAEQLRNSNMPMGAGAGLYQPRFDEEQ